MRICEFASAVSTHNNWYGVVRYVYQPYHFLLHINTIEKYATLTLSYHHHVKVICYVMFFSFVVCE